MCPEDYKVEALYNDEVQSLENQMMDSYQNYKRQWESRLEQEIYSGWNDQRGGKWRDMENVKDRYVYPHNRPRPKDLTGPEGNLTKEMLTGIFNKVEGSDKVLKELKITSPPYLKQ